MKQKRAVAVYCSITKTAKIFQISSNQNETQRTSTKSILSVGRHRISFVENNQFHSFSRKNAERFLIAGRKTKINELVQRLCTDKCLNFITYNIDTTIIRRI